MKQKIDLLIIDPQNDFCNEKVVDSGGKIIEQAALYVHGAEDDMTRLANMIDRIGHHLRDIRVTLDSHRLVDIAHPIFWTDDKGNHPTPFTIITGDDIRKGVWRATYPGHQRIATTYISQLEKNNRYPLCIWPPHCLIGYWGHNYFPAIGKALMKWEEENFANVDIVTKGSNPFTEHYSGVQADVPDQTDPSTQINTRLITALEEADTILLAGEARSHCLANTVRDIVNRFDVEGKNDYVKKMVLLTDATSDVADLPGQTMFKDIGEAFVSDMRGKGMRVSTTTEFLS